MSAGGPGLQPERTALAWTRTAAVALVSGVLLVRFGIHGGDPLPIAAAVAALALAVFALRRRRLRLSAATRAPRARLMLAVAGLTTACGALALAGVLAAT